MQNKHQPVQKLQSVNLRPTTPLRLTVWRLRRTARSVFGKEIFDTEDTQRTKTHKARQIYLKVDDFIKKYLPNLEKETPRPVACQRVLDTLSRDLDYNLAEVNTTKPWGAYYRIADDQAERFITEFFPGLTLAEAKLGREDVVLSPKILLVYPGQRLSWQYHDRRSERWRFLTDGAYHKSPTDDEGQPYIAKAGTIVQFDTGERHRLCAVPDDYTLVAEIWQHTDASLPSNEDDIVRLQDDYNR